MYTFSSEHQEYLKKERRRKILILFCRILIILFFFSIWEVLADSHCINTFLYSSPSRIVKTIYFLSCSKELWPHIFITVEEVFLGFTISSIFGIFGAFLLWKFDFLSQVLDPYITILNSLPKVALGPLIIIWIGASMHSIIFMAVMISLFTTILSIYNAFLAVPSYYILLLKSFKANSWQIFWKVVFPSNLVMILSTLKINVSLNLIGVIMGELLVSKKGLGYLIMYGSQVFRLDLVISSIFILGVISYLMYLIIDWILVYVQKKRSSF